MSAVGSDGEMIGKKSPGCLNLLRSTAWQCPGVGEIWSPWGWDRLYYLLSGCLAQGIAWWKDGQAGSRIRHVLLWRQRHSLPSMMSFDMLCVCDCVSACRRILSYASLARSISDWYTEKNVKAMLNFLTVKYLKYYSLWLSCLLNSVFQ